jgi:glycosyltransferase involved in cell wall biosynthesis
VSDNKPLIIHIITGLNIGGAEMMLYKICKYKSDKINYEVISLTDKGPMAERIESLGVKVSAVRLNKNPFSLFRLITLINHIRKSKPKLIQTWMYHSDLIGAIISLVARVPVYWNIRQASVNIKLNKVHTVLTSLACGLLSFIPKKILSCTNKGIEEHSKIGYQKSKMVFVPNGFEVNEYHIREHHNKIKKIIHVGRYAPLKNHLAFVRIAKIINEHYPYCEFEMYGDNVTEYNPELTNLISKLKLTLSVHLLGRNSNLINIYPISDILVSTSLSEGFSNTIGEAMCCGVDVVTTNVGDSALIVDNQENTFSPEQEEHIAMRVVELLNSDPNPNSNREKIVSRFNILKTVNQYESLYLE